MEKIILIGGGGHCRSCIDVIEQEGRFEIAGIIDVAEKIGESIFSYPIIGTDDDIKTLKDDYKFFFITLGQIENPKLRMKIFDLLLSFDLNPPVIISPNSYISKHAKIGEGTIIMHGAIINAGAVIGKNCIINSRALIEHDSIVEDNCHISTSAVINGGVRVGNGTFFGSGAISKQYISIPSLSFIKANSIVK